MSGWSAPRDPAAPAASWQSLSGDSTAPAQPSLPPYAEQAQPQGGIPIHGGWQQAWRDEQGQWHYPYAAAQPAPAGLPSTPPAPAATPAPVTPVEDAAAGAYAPPVMEPVLVQPEELAPVGPPRYLAPVRVAHDPRQRTLAAVIVFVCLLVGLWAMLAFLGDVARTQASILSGSTKLEQQLTTANVGLRHLEQKTRHLERMSDDSGQLKGLLRTIDSDMGEMLTSVDRIATSMQAMEGSLGTLDGELTKVNEVNAGMASELGSISGGLGTQVQTVRSMRVTGQRTQRLLDSLPGRLAATNGRLGFINGAVNTMGCRGITNNLEVDIKLGPIPNGSAKVYATVVPPGAWGMQPDGRTPC